VLYLLIASVLWSFSFGMIKTQLTGYDPNLVAALRLLFSWLMFAPFLKWVGFKRVSVLMGLGAVQFGVMYVVYIASYRYLPAHQVAAWTITTPIFVVMIDSLMKHRWRTRFWVGAGLAVLGGLIMNVGGGVPALKGIVLLQAANLCFALGQVGYKQLGGSVGSHAQRFAWMYLGAVLVPLIWILPTGTGPLPSSAGPWLALLYLGLIPSGLGFFLWNRGAVKVSSGVLAVWNNAKIPLAVIVSWAFFSDQVNWPRVILSLGVMSAGYWVARRR